MPQRWCHRGMLSFVLKSGPRLYKEPSAKSNKHIIQNALAHCCLAGKVNEGQKNKILEVRRGVLEIILIWDDKSGALPLLLHSFFYVSVQNILPFKLVYSPHLYANQSINNCDPNRCTY